jgi:hypothetical protein
MKGYRNKKPEYIKNIMKKAELNAIVSQVYSPDDAHKKEYRLRAAVLVSFLLFYLINY